MKLSVNEIARMTDVAGVAGGFSEAEVEDLARCAKEYRCIGAHVMPCYVPKLAALLAGEDDVLVGSVVGFPSGAHATEVKLHEARLNLSHGCRELDMVINVGALRSGRLQYCEDEIRAVVDAAAGKTVKVILETHFLTPDEIKRGCEVVLRAGAPFVKTSTGWAPTGATVESVALIKSIVGDAAQIKAAGGIRTLDALVALYACGARRFGIGVASARAIFEQCTALPDGQVDVPESGRAS